MFHAAELFGQNVRFFLTEPRRPAPGDATRPEDGFEPALFDCEGIS